MCPKRIKTNFIYRQDTDSPNTNKQNLPAQQAKYSKLNAGAEQVQKERGKLNTIAGLANTEYMQANAELRPNAVNCIQKQNKFRKNRKKLNVRAGRSAQTE